MLSTLNALMPTMHKSPAEQDTRVDQDLSQNATLTQADGAKFAAENDAWNKDVCKYTPAVIAQPRTTAEVGTVVAAANKFGARLVIAGGRHGHDCLADGAVVLDMSKMKKVTE